MNDIKTYCEALRKLAFFGEAKTVNDAADMLETVARQRDELKRQLDIALAENLELRTINQGSENWKDDELYCFRCDRVMSACGCPMNDNHNQGNPGL